MGWWASSVRLRCIIDIEAMHAIMLRKHGKLTEVLRMISDFNISDFRECKKHMDSIQ